MARNNYLLNIVIKGKQFVTKPVTAAQRALGNLERQIRRTSEEGQASFPKLAGAFTSLVVAKHAARAMAGLLKPATDLQRVTTQLSVATGAGAEDLRKMRSEALNVAAATKFTPAEAIQGMTKLRLATTSTEAATSSLLPTLSLAQTFFEGQVGPAADLASKLVRGFGLQGDQLGVALDKLAGASRLSGVQLKDLSGGFNKLGAAAKIAGAGFDEIIPLFALSVKQGINARLTTTGLVNVFSRLADPKIQGKLSETFGIITTENGKLKDVRTLMLQLAQAYRIQGNDARVTAFITKNFGRRALAPLIGILKGLSEGTEFSGQGVKEMAEIFTTFAQNGEASRGMLSRLTEESVKPLGARIELLTQAITRLLGEAFLPLVETLGSALAPITANINAFAAWLESGSYMAETLKTIAGALFTFAGVIIGLIAIKLAWVGITRIVGAALSFANVSVVGLSVSMAQNTLAIFTNAREMFGWIKMAFAATRVVGTLRNRIFALRTAFGLLFRSILGPIGLILTLASVIAPLLGFGKKMEGIAGKKAQKEQDKAAAMQAKMEATLRQQADQLRTFAARTDEFTAAVTFWAEAQKERAPVAPIAAIGRVEQELQKLFKGKRIAGSDFAFAEGQLNLVREAMRKMTEEGEISRGELDRARVAFTTLALGIESEIGSSKEFVAIREAMNKALSGASSGTLAMARARIALGIGESELVKTRLQRIKAAKQDVEATREQIKVQRELSRARGRLLAAEDTAQIKDLLKARKNQTGEVVRQVKTFAKFFDQQAKLRDEMQSMSLAAAKQLPFATEVQGVTTPGPTNQTPSGKKTPQEHLAAIPGLQSVTNTKISELIRVTKQGNSEIKEAIKKSGSGTGTEPDEDKD